MNAPQSSPRIVEALGGPRLGSLFSGYGGLEMGVQMVLGGSTAWHVEFDPAPSRVLAHHWPDVPNYGDVTAVDWSTVEPVDVLTGGFPCQDVSLAGRRAGMREGTRSGLWSHFARAIDVLRPGIVVIENVRGLLSADADRNMELDPWALGDRGARSTLRALGAVLGDLADLGYDADWCGLRAADAGAPHARYRIFVVAHPAGLGLREAVARLWAGQPDAARGAHAPTDTDDCSCDRRERASGRRPQLGGAAPGHRPQNRATAYPGDNRRERGHATHDDDRPLAHGLDAHRCATPSPDIGRLGSERRGDARDLGSPQAEGEEQGDQRQRDGDTPDDRHSIDWAEFTPAIRQWEHLLGRVAPAPTHQLAANGALLIAPRFEEWMMGLPDGHVTDPAIWIGMKPSPARKAQLKALGNGVVPQQAALAVGTLIQREALAA